jgi:TfoX/Sxy family transcriptional regulator of competence genes
VAYNESLADRIRTALGARPGVEEKKMFGGVSFMVDGQMCLGVLKDDLVVKVGAEGFDDALAQPDSRPFDFTGRPMGGMVYVAGAGLSSDEVLRGWVERGLEFVRLHPKTPGRGARRRA